VLLLIKNFKFKVKKLILKFINLFKIFKYIKELVYKLKLLSLYNCLYFTFYISFFKEYIFKKKVKNFIYILLKNF
jgi:hypothetical protein